MGHLTRYAFLCLRSLKESARVLVDVVADFLDPPHFPRAQGPQFQGPQRIHRAALQGLVLEVKYNGGIPDWLSELQEILGLRRVKRFSKFARSIRRLTELRGLEESLWAG